jgi:hypothetical protein
MRMFGLMAAVLLCQSGSAFAQSILPEGLTIHLETKEAISSKKAKKGDSVNFVVRDPVVIGGVTLVPAGSPAVGQVTAVRDNGKLEISVSHVDVGGRQIPVRGASDKKGASGAVGAVGAAVVFLPLGIFVRGREAQLKPGTPVDVFVAQEVQMAETAAPPPTPQQSAETLMPVPLPASAAAEPEPLPPPPPPEAPSTEELPPLPP